LYWAKAPPEMRAVRMNKMVFFIGGFLLSFRTIVRNLVEDT
jgi:hypothetical protein